MNSSKFRLFSQAVLVLVLCLVVGSTAQTAPSANSTPSTVLLTPSDPRIVLLGRMDKHDASQPRMGYPGTTIRFRFTGSSAWARFSSDTDTAAVTTVVDGGQPTVHELKKGLTDIVLAAGLDTGQHTAEIVKRTETWQGTIRFLGVGLAPDGTLADPGPLPKRKIMFIGDSVTCGAGLDHAPGCKDGLFRPTNAYDSYGMLLGRRLDAQVHLVCFGGRGLIRDYRGRRDVLNAPQFFGLSVPADEPSQQAEWSPSDWLPDAILVSIGTNDFNLQKTQPLAHDEFVETYVTFVRGIREKYPEAVIMLTQGAIVTDDTLKVFIRDTVAKVNDPHVIWVGSRHYPGLDCDAHPTRAEHRRMADDFEPVFRQTLGW